MNERPESRRESMAELVQALAEANQQIRGLETRLAEYQWIEEALRRRTRDLNERIKELECLYAVADCLRADNRDLGHLLQSVVNVIPRGYQHAEATTASIEIHGRTFTSGPARPASASDSCPIAVHGVKSGTVRVQIDTSMLPPASPFLPEERALLRTLATWIGEIVAHATIGKAGPDR